MTVTMRAWFRALAAGFKSPAPAQTVSGLAILLLSLYTGYTIPQPSMIGALRWITWINVSCAEQSYGVLLTDAVYSRLDMVSRPCSRTSSIL